MNKMDSLFVIGIAIATAGLLTALLNIYLFVIIIIGIAIMLFSIIMEGNDVIHIERIEK